MSLKANKEASLQRASQHGWDEGIVPTHSSGRKRTAKAQWEACGKKSQTSFLGRKERKENSVPEVKITVAVREPGGEHQRRPLG